MSGNESVTDRLPTVIEALTKVMEAVQSVRKTDRNTSQNFNFRGIDAVVNAVGPAMHTHGVVAVPVEVVPQFESYQSRQGAQMRNTVLCITWRFYGPAGDHIEAQTLGEASDAGDKSVPKAHSVAYRTLLLQALCIPTDEPDPDSYAHERSTPDADEQWIAYDSMDPLKEAIDQADTVPAVEALYDRCAAAKLRNEDKHALKAYYDARLAELSGVLV
jgi:hypothetical protein